MYREQKIDPEGHFKITEGYYADSLFDYYKIASGLIDSLHDVSVADSEQGDYCFERLHALYAKLERILDTHPKS